MASESVGSCSAMSSIEPPPCLGVDPLRGQNVRSGWSWVAGENREGQRGDMRDLGDHCSQEGRIGGHRQVHLNRWMDTGRNGYIDGRTQIGR